MEEKEGGLTVKKGLEACSLLYNAHTHPPG